MLIILLPDEVFGVLAFPEGKEGRYNRSITKHYGNLPGRPKHVTINPPAIGIPSFTDPTLSLPVITFCFSNITHKSPV